MHKFSLLSSIILFFGTINTLPSHRYRRQINSAANIGSSNGRLSAWLNAPSGSVPGTAYYRPGADPNYGTYISPANSAGGGGAVAQISYDPNSGSFLNVNQQQNYLPNVNQQQNYLPNVNNAWQTSNVNTNYRQPYNPYAPGSQGWYVNGGNFWYNSAQSLIIYPCLLIINIVLLILCK